MKFTKLIFIAAVTALLASCCYCQQYQRKFGRPLQDTRWTLSRTDGRAIGGDYVMVLSSEGMKITGDATITASYRYSDRGKLQFDEIKTDGQPKDEAMLQHILGILSEIDGYKMDGQFLMLTHQSEMRTVLEAKDPKTK